MSEYVVYMIKLPSSTNSGWHKNHSKWEINICYFVCCFISLSLSWCWHLNANLTVSNHLWFVHLNFHYPPHPWYKYKTWWWWWWLRSPMLMAMAHIKSTHVKIAIKSLTTNRLSATHRSWIAFNFFGLLFNHHLLTFTK